MATLRDRILNPVRPSVSGQQLVAEEAGEFRRGLRGTLLGAQANTALAEEASLRAQGDTAAADAQRMASDNLRAQQGMAPRRISRVEDINGVGDAADWALGAVGSGIGSMAEPVAAGALTSGVGGVMQMLPNPVARSLGRGLQRVGTPGVVLGIGAEQQKGEFYGQATEDPEIMRRYNAEQLNDVSNAVGLAGGALDAILPTSIAKGITGAGLRRGLSSVGPGARTVGGAVVEGATEVGQGEIGRQVRGVMNPEQATEGFGSDRLNEFAEGAVGGAGPAAAGAFADAGFRRLGDTAARGGEALGESMGQVIDMGKDAAEQATGLFKRGKEKVIDLKPEDVMNQLKEATNGVASKWKTNEEEINLMRGEAPPEIMDDDAAYRSWYSENNERRSQIITDRLKELADAGDQQAAQYFEGMNNPDALEDTIDVAGLYVADQSRLDDTARAAERLGAAAGTAARAAGRVVSQVGGAFWDGVTKSKKNMQTKEVDDNDRTPLLGDFMMSMTRPEIQRYGRVKGDKSIPRYMRQLGNDLTAMINVGAAKDPRALLHINRMANHMVGAYGSRAALVAEEMANMVGADGKPLMDLLSEQIDKAQSTATARENLLVRNAAADLLLAALPRTTEARLMKEGINLRTPEGKRQLLGMTEAVATGRATPGARKALEQLVGEDTMIEMVRAITPGAKDAETEADAEAALFAKEEDEKTDVDGGEGEMDDDADDSSVETSDFDKNQAEKKLERQGGVKYYGFGGRPTIDNSKSRRNPFAPISAATENTPARRPQLLRKDQLLSDGKTLALEKKRADMENYLRTNEGENIDVSERSAAEVMDSMNMRPPQRLAAMADYMFQESRRLEGTDEGAQMAAQARLVRKVVQDIASGARPGKGAIGGTMDRSAKTTAGERQRVLRMLNGYTDPDTGVRTPGFFETRFLVVGEQKSDVDPERITRADFDNMVKIGKTVMNQREAKDDFNGHAQRNGILFFEDAEGNSLPIKADDLSRFSLTARRANEEAGTSTRQWINDLNSGIAALLESGFATALPTHLDIAGEVESFENGIPLNLLLPNGKMYGETVAQRKRKSRSIQGTTDLEGRDAPIQMGPPVPLSRARRNDDITDSVAAEQAQDEIFTPDDTPVAESEYTAERTLGEATERARRRKAQGDKKLLRQLIEEERRERLISPQSRRGETEDAFRDTQIRTRMQGMEAANLPRNAKVGPSKKQLNAASDRALGKTGFAEPPARPARPPAVAPAPAAPRAQDLSTPRKFLDALRALHDETVEEGDASRERFASLTGKINVRAKGDEAAQRSNVPLIQQLDDAFSGFVRADKVPFTEKQENMARYLLSRLRQAHAYVWEDRAEGVAATPGKPLTAAQRGVLESRLREMAAQASKRDAMSIEMERSATEIISALAKAGYTREQLFEHPTLKGIMQILAVRRSLGEDVNALLKSIYNRADQLYGFSTDKRLNAKISGRLIAGGGKVSEFMADIIADPNVPTVFKVIAGGVTKVAGSVLVRPNADIGGEGEFNSVRGDIFIKGAGSLQVSQVVLHEAVHAATVRAMYKDADLQRAVYNLMAHVVGQDKDIVAAYGMTNTLEFLAEGFSNHGFQERLAKIKPNSTVAKYLGENVANAWESFVALVRKALAIPADHDSALAQLLDLGARAMRETAKAGVVSNMDEVISAINRPMVPMRVVNDDLNEIAAMDVFTPDGRNAFESFREDIFDPSSAGSEIPTKGPAFTHNQATTVAMLVESLRAQKPRTIGEAEFKTIFASVASYADRAATFATGTFNAQDARKDAGDTSTMGERKEAIEYVKKVLGPEIKVQFQKIVGYSGEWVDAENTVYISTTAAAGAQQTSYHEALHAFFSKFVKNDQRAFEVLKELAENKGIIERVHAMLEGYPAAQAQLKDGEERLAYIYQFWADGKLDLPYGKPRTLFQKIGKFFRKILGMVNNTERAVVMFEAFHNGDFGKTPAEADRAKQRALNQGTWTRKQLRKMDGLTQRAAAFVMPAESILLTSVSESAQKIGRAFYANPGDEEAGKGETGYLNAREQMNRRYANEFSHIVSGMTSRDYTDVAKLMNSETDLAAISYAPHRKAVKELRALLRRFRQYMVDERGVQMGDQGEKYFPRVWSMDKLINNAPAFYKMMEEKYPDHNAEAVYQSLLTNLADDLEYGRPANEEGVLTPLNRSGEERVLSWMAAEDAAGFLEDNLVGVLTRYFHEGTRAAEYTHRFGQDGKRLAFMLSNTNTELRKEGAAMVRRGELKDQAAADKWAERQFRDVREAVGAMEGTLGKDISATWRKTNSWVVVYQNIRLLPLSLFASVVDPLGVVARGGEFREAYEAFLRGMGEVGRQWGDLFRSEPRDRQTDRWERLAEYVGSVDAAIFETQVSDMYSSVYMTPQAKAINQTFFKLNGMEAWNRGMRVGATKAAVQFIMRHSKLPDTHSQRWLDELGVKSSDIMIGADGNLLVTVGEIAAAKGIDRETARVVANRLHTAINRWVTGAVLTPNAAQRPAWGSDPHYSMFFHLKQFTYSFHQTILKRAANELNHGNIAPLGALFWYIPVMIASDITKGLIQGGGELPAHMKGMDAAEWLMHGAERAGLIGLGQLGMDANADIASIGGPAVEQVIDAFSDPLERTAVASLPANPLYREALR